jgi:transcriptional regulator with GAF, ATPase, and Fis domain
MWQRRISSKVKGTNKLNGIISGNAVQDSRNVLALVELIKLVNSNQSKKEKIYSFLGRIIEIMEAQYGAMLIIKDDEVTEHYGRKALDEEWTKDISYSKNTVRAVIDNKQGVYMIDWDAVGNYDLITGVPDWYSILAVPISSGNQINGVIYLSTSTKVKEFGFNEFNFINVLSDLAATII